MRSKSENNIIHITEKFRTLKLILSSNSLKLSFSSEDFYYNNIVVSKAAHPMISFSEYNVSTIDKERITYGKYGVGFSKEWAETNNIGPVLYVGSTSVAAKGMKELLKARRKTNSEKLPGKIRLAIMEVKTFMKNKKGYNSKLEQENFDFKAENEWRYVPRKLDIDSYLISQNQRTYLKNRDKHNKMLEKYPLGFKREDIQFVFVSNQSEKDELIKTFGLDIETIKISNWKNE